MARGLHIRKVKSATLTEEDIMITRSKQNWEVGNTVKVGFLSLRVLSVRAEFDGLPDIYTLANQDGTRLYEFIPHNGLTRIN